MDFLRKSGYYPPPFRNHKDSAERYRSGRNGIDSKSIWGPKALTGVRIPLSPPFRSFVCFVCTVKETDEYRPDRRDRKKYGGMSERLKEHDWKSCVCPQRCTGGSNPPLSARIDSRALCNGGLRTPSGPEGSSGSKNRRVLQVNLAIFFLQIKQP